MFEDILDKEKKIHRYYNIDATKKCIKCGGTVIVVQCEDYDKGVVIKSYNRSQCTKCGNAFYSSLK